MRRRLLGCVLGCLAVVTTGCVGIPDEAPITEAGTGVAPGEELGYYNDPPAPEPGAPPTEIVKGFLDAQAAIPVQTNTAELFLTEDEAATWEPEQQTVTYAAASVPSGSNRVTVELDGTNRIDARGSWRGPLPRDEQELVFTMRRVDGEWRIDQAPDARVVPDTWFGQAYRRVSVFYLDPTASILVPEPVYVPRGDQLASSLVDALLDGPVSSLEGVARSAIPAGLELDLSVTVTEEAVGVVELTGDASMPGEQDALLMVSQLANTLAQDPALESFRVNINSEPVTLAGGVTTFEMDEGLVLDPTGVQSTSLLFGLREGRLVVGAPGDLQPASGRLGAQDRGIRSVGASLSGARVAAVTDDGSRVVVTDVADEDARVVQVLSGGTDVLPPVWDFRDRLWLVNRVRGATSVSVFAGGRLRELTVPGISGENVVHALVSRDGSRLVAVIDRRRGDRVLVSRIAYDTRGRAMAASPAREIAWADQPRVNVIDIEWSSPTSLVIAHRLGGDLFQVRTLSVDGAPAGLTGLAATLRERPVQLVSSPLATDPVLTVTRGGVVDVLTASAAAAPDPDLTYLTYAGG